MAICNDIIKSREIRFKPSNVGNQAELTTGLAADLLRDVAGIADTTIINDQRIRIKYDVRELTLQMIENALIEVGFMLNSGLLQRIKRAIFAYCEDALRERLGIHQTSAEPQTISLPQNFTQDPRPDNWRHYS